MDARLAEIYGTGQTSATETEEDLQKTAAAELLVKLAEEQKIDLSKCSDEQVEAMVRELYKTAGEMPPQFQKKEEGGEKKDEGKEKKETKGEESSGESSAEESKEASEKEAQAKFAEADFLGRVMAHAMYQEMGAIEKEAGKAGDAAKGALNFLKNKGKAVGAAASNAAKKPGVQAAGAGVAGAAAGAAAAHKALGKKKEGSAASAESPASAFDVLVQRCAYDMAKEAGFVDEEGNLTPPEQKGKEEEVKQASALDIAVRTSALRLLEANGYPVVWGK